MAIQQDVIIKVLLAIVLGGVIGGEREARDKNAGFRTIILICLGATLFTMLSTYLAQGNDPARIAANIVSGIGFLGAGAILHSGNRITGLTTASTIWLAAAMGMAVGFGEYIVAIIGTLAALVVLWVFPFFEDLIDLIRHTRTYHMTCQADLQSWQQVFTAITQHGLKINSSKQTKSGGQIVVTCQVSGTPKAHQALIEALLVDENVLELSF